MAYTDARELALLVDQQYSLQWLAMNDYRHLREKADGYLAGHPFATERLRTTHAALIESYDSVIYIARAGMNMAYEVLLTMAKYAFYGNDLPGGIASAIVTPQHKTVFSYAADLRSAVFPPRQPDFKGSKLAFDTGDATFLAQILHNREVIDAGTKDSIGLSAALKDELAQLAEYKAAVTNLNLKIKDSF